MEKRRTETTEKNEGKKTKTEPNNGAHFRFSKFVHPVPANWHDWVITTDKVAYFVNIRHVFNSYFLLAFPSATTTILFSERRITNLASIDRHQFVCYYISHKVWTMSHKGKHSTANISKQVMQFDSIDNILDTQLE